MHQSLTGLFAKVTCRFSQNTSTEVAPTPSSYFYAIEPCDKGC